MARGLSAYNPRKGFVFVRIRRMGAQFATCGVGIMPPKDRMHEPGILDLATKLVPGQVVELPSDHDLTSHPVCELVRGPEADEFIRPWVFESAEEAVMADPSRSGLDANQIANGLALTRGATYKQREALEERQRVAREIYDDENEEPVQDFPDENLRRSQNREAGDIYADAVSVRDDEPAETDDEPAPRGRRRPGRVARS